VKILANVGANSGVKPSICPLYGFLEKIKIEKTQNYIKY
jgi:hypothetical protein